MKDSVYIDENPVDIMFLGEATSDSNEILQFHILRNLTPNTEIVLSWIERVSARNRNGLQYDIVQCHTRKKNKCDVA